MRSRSTGSSSPNPVRPMNGVRNDLRNRDLMPLPLRRRDSHHRLEQRRPDSPTMPISRTNTMKFSRNNFHGENRDRLRRSISSERRTLHRPLAVVVNRNHSRSSSRNHTFDNNVSKLRIDRRDNSNNGGSGLRNLNRKPLVFSLNKLSQNRPVLKRRVLDAGSKSRENTRTPPPQRRRTLRRANVNDESDTFKAVSGVARQRGRFGSLRANNSRERRSGSRSHSRSGKIRTTVHSEVDNEGRALLKFGRSTSIIRRTSSSDSRRSSGSRSPQPRRDSHLRRMLRPSKSTERRRSVSSSRASSPREETYRRRIVNGKRYLSPPGADPKSTRNFSGKKDGKNFSSKISLEQLFMTPIDIDIPLTKSNTSSKQPSPSKSNSRSVAAPNQDSKNIDNGATANMNSRNVGRPAVQTSFPPPPRPMLVAQAMRIEHPIMPFTKVHMCQPSSFVGISGNRFSSQTNQQQQFPGARSGHVTTNMYNGGMAGAIPGPMPNSNFSALMVGNNIMPLNQYMNGPMMNGTSSVVASPFTSPPHPPLSLQSPPSGAPMTGWNGAPLFPSQQHGVFPQNGGMRMPQQQQQPYYIAKQQQQQQQQQFLNMPRPNTNMMPSGFNNQQQQHHYQYQNQHLNMHADFIQMMDYLSELLDADEAVLQPEVLRGVWPIPAPQPSVCNIPNLGPTICWPLLEEDGSITLMPIICLAAEREVESLLVTPPVFTPLPHVADGRQPHGYYTVSLNSVRTYDPLRELPPAPPAIEMPADDQPTKLLWQICNRLQQTRSIYKRCKSLVATANATVESAAADAVAAAAAATATNSNSNSSSADRRNAATRRRQQRHRHDSAVAAAQQASAVCSRVGDIHEKLANSMRRYSSAAVSAKFEHDAELIRVLQRPYTIYNDLLPALPRNINSVVGAAAADRLLLGAPLAEADAADSGGGKSSAKRRMSSTSSAVKLGHEVSTDEDSDAERKAQHRKRRKKDKKEQHHRKRRHDTYSNHRESVGGEEDEQPQSNAEKLDDFGDDDNDANVAGGTERVDDAAFAQKSTGGIDDVVVGADSIPMPPSPNVAEIG